MSDFYVKIGDGATFSKTVSEYDVYGFAGITGDNNPVHINEEFASETMFSGRIAHGMLTGAFVSTVLGMKLPGPGAIYVSQTLRFKAPVRIGDVATAIALASVGESSGEDHRQLLAVVAMGRDLPSGGDADQARAEPLRVGDGRIVGIVHDGKVDVGVLRCHLAGGVAQQKADGDDHVVGLLGELMDRYGADCWLVNTGWTGDNVGDLYVGAKINLLSQFRQNPAALAIRATVKAPTGKKAVGTSSGTPLGAIS